jgi:hypothetical protein
MRPDATLSVCGGSCCASRGAYFACFEEVRRDQCVAARSARVGSRNYVTWGPDGVVAVAADIEVRDATLAVLAGSVLVFTRGARIVARRGADVRILGSSERPCVLTAGERHHAWGGIDVRPGSSAVFMHTLLVGGAAIVVDKAALSFIGGAILNFRPEPAARCGPRHAPTAGGGAAGGPSTSDRARGAGAAATEEPVATHRSFAVQISESSFTMHSTLLTGERKCTGLISARRAYFFDVHESHLIFVERPFAAPGAYLPVPALVMSGEPLGVARGASAGAATTTTPSRKKKKKAVGARDETDAAWNTTSSGAVAARSAAAAAAAAAARAKAGRPFRRRRAAWMLLLSLVDEPASHFTLRRTTLIDSSAKQHQHAAIVASGVELRVNRSFVAGWASPPMRTFGGVRSRNVIGVAAVAEVIHGAGADAANAVGLCRAPQLCAHAGALQRGASAALSLTWRALHRSKCDAVARRYAGQLVVSRHWLDGSNERALHRLELWRHVRLSTVAPLVCVEAAGRNFWLVYSRPAAPAFVALPSLVDVLRRMPPERNPAKGAAGRRLLRRASPLPPPSPLSKRAARRALQTMVHVAAALAFMHHSPLGTLLHSDLRAAHILVDVAAAHRVQLTGLAHIVLLGGLGVSDEVPAEWIPGCCLRADGGALPREASAQSPECDMCTPVGAASDVYQLALRLVEFAAALSDPSFRPPLQLTLASHFEGGVWGGEARAVLPLLPRGIDTTFPGLRAIFARCLDVVPARRPKAVQLVALLRAQLKPPRAANSTARGNATRGTTWGATRGATQQSSS